MENKTQMIRNYIINILIDAKRQGKTTLNIRAGDIHKQMHLLNNYPSVCSAMRSLDGYKDYEEIILPTPRNPKNTNANPHRNGANLTIKYILNSK